MLARARGRAYRGAMSELHRRVDEAAARSSFAGVVQLERAGVVALDAAYGLADRSHGIAMTTDNQLGMASGSKATRPDVHRPSARLRTSRHSTGASSAYPEVHWLAGP